MTAAQYDFIIVGGGTAGLVLANRLTEDAQTSVLVLEAGENAAADPRVAIPAFFTALFGTQHDWSFHTAPQKHLGDRIIGHPQGKMLGGSSALNAQALIAPSAADLDTWERLGNTGWNWNNMKRYLQKFYSLTKPDDETCKDLHLTWLDEEVRGTEGPIKASFPGVKENPLVKAWVEAFEALGYPMTADPFTGRSTGAYNAPATIDPATITRSDSNGAYYIPVSDRPNLNVQTGCTAEKILLDLNGSERVATGIKYVQDGVRQVVNAKEEVIICAGVFHSPKLLQLSGIGDSRLLGGLGIDVEISNPYVGLNLQDHLVNGISFEVNDGVPSGDELLRQNPEAIQAAMIAYQTSQQGPLCASGINAFGYLPTLDFVVEGGSTERDSLFDQHSSVPQAHPLDSFRLAALRQLHADPREGSAQYFLFAAQTNTAGTHMPKPMSADLQQGNFITLCAALSHPLSTGTVQISSADPTAKPLVDHNYLAHPLDLELQARHVRILERIAAAEPIVKLLKPDGRRNHSRASVGDDLDKAKEYVRMAAASNWHSVGTCAMAPKDLGGVVDSDLRVYGTSNLRVVDASIMPLVPQSNTQSLVYAIAEKAADLIKRME